jgi:uncharacterized membrane protein YheB (UPF0754 family)
VIAWISLPLIGALIGWFTNRLALWMLFRPQRPVRVFFCSWQGVIPSRQEQLADALARVLEEHLLTPEDHRALLDAVNIEEHLDRIVTQTLQRQIPGSLFQRIPAAEGLREKLIDALRGHIVRRMPKKLSEIDEAILVKVAADIDVAGHVRNRILNIPLDELEAVVWKIARKELRVIEFAGAGIGFVIGVVQAGFLYGWQYWMGVL